MSFIILSQPVYEDWRHESKSFADQSASTKIPDLQRRIGHRSRNRSRAFARPLACSPSLGVGPAIGHVFTAKRRRVQGRQAWDQRRGLATRSSAAIVSAIGTIAAAQRRALRVISVMPRVSVSNAKHRRVDSESRWWITQNRERNSHSFHVTARIRPRGWSFESARADVEQIGRALPARRYPEQGTRVRRMDVDGRHVGRHACARC